MSEAGPSKERSAIRVAIVDSSEIFQDGLRVLCSQRNDITLSAAFADLEEAINLLEHTKVDVLLVDACSLDLVGTELGCVVTASRPGAVLVLASEPDRNELVSIMQAGARGYISKRADTGTLVEAIRITGAGDTFFDPSLTVETLLARETDRPDVIEYLNGREKLVLSHLAKARSNREIAAALQLRETTVQYDIRRICDKLCVRNRTEAAVVSVDLLKA